MAELYAPFVRTGKPIIFMDIPSAEMTKYAANAMLATRISFMNEIAALCERMEVDVENVRRGIGSDSRIGPSFIYPGCGYGGSCFPKDVKALIYMAETNSVIPEVLRAVEARNRSQKQRLFEKIRETMPATGPGDVTDEAKADIVAFLLQSNGFPAGTTELRAEADTLGVIDIVRAGQRATIPNFSLVQVVGCLTQGANNGWVLYGLAESQQALGNKAEAAAARAALRKTWVGNPAWLRMDRL